MKEENLVKAKQIAEESFRQGLVSQSIPKSVRKYTDKLAMKVNGLIPIAVVRKAIDDLPVVKMRYGYDREAEYVVRLSDIKKMENRLLSEAKEDV